MSCLNEKTKKNEYNKQVKKYHNALRELYHYAQSFNDEKLLLLIQKSLAEHINCKILLSNINEKEGY